VNGSHDSISYFLLGSFTVGETFHWMYRFSLLLYLVLLSGSVANK
jgi:hypothetical protein